MREEVGQREREPKRREERQGDANDTENAHRWPIVDDLVVDLLQAIAHPPTRTHQQDKHPHLQVHHPENPILREIKEKKKVVGKELN